ncbi:secretion activator protein [Polaromonas phage Tiera]|nr:secretion activator protein [Polaromonas phage Tiera]
MNINDKKLMVADILKAEGGYVNHPSDKGGPTAYGVTEGAARSAGYLGDMKDFTKEMAETVYIARYIERPGFDRVYDVDAKVGAELIDTGVNMGPPTAGTFFQRWLNVLNMRGAMYSDLFVDGSVGPATIAAYKAFLAKRGPEGSTRMLKALNAIQGARYLELAEKSPSQEDFAYGWLARI